MSKLFIIGNGFDRAHGMATSYEDFHKFLRDKYNLTDEDESWLDKPFDIQEDKHGDSIPDEREIARLFCGLVSKSENYRLWRDVENDMGLFDYYECFDDSCHPETDMDDKYDRQRTHAIFNSEDRANEIYSVLNDVEPILRKWIENVKICDKKNPLFKLLINPKDDLFLNFNYTKTLENLYGCNNVCHIHGCIDNGEKLTIGHGNDKVDFYDDNNLPDSTVTRGTLTELHRKLRKNTREVIERNRTFFDKLKESDIKNIYSYGFSFSSVDIPYIQYICSILDTSDITWYLNNYCKDHLECHKTIIQLAGFKGNFDIFSV